MLRPVTPADHDAFLALCREFYHSPAVLAPIPDEHIENTFRELFSPQPLAAAYLIFSGKPAKGGSEQGEPAGYCLLATAFSNEAGGRVQWLEELYIRPAFQGQGLGSEVFAYLDAHRPPDVRRFRLEVEPENEGAMRLYRRKGFRELPYLQMVRDFD